jgi:hypothetical protein
MSNKKDFVVVGARVLGLYVIFLGLLSSPGQIAMLLSSQQSADPMIRTMMGVGLVSVGVTILFGLILWIYSKHISGIICKDLDEQDNIHINPTELQTIMVSVLGLYILSMAIPSLTNIFVSHIFPKSNPKYNYELAAGGRAVVQIPIADYASAGIKVMFGLLCTLKAEGIVEIIRAIWVKGRGIET